MTVRKVIPRFPATVASLAVIPLLLLSSCGNPIERDSIIGEWIHTRTGDVPGDKPDETTIGSRRDRLVLEEDGTYSRHLTSDLPGDPASLDWEGRWSLRGHRLTLRYRKEDESPGIAKGKVRIVEEGKSITVGGRFYVKVEKPETERQVSGKLTPTRINASVME